MRILIDLPFVLFILYTLFSVNGIRSVILCCFSLWLLLHCQCSSVRTQSAHLPILLENLRCNLQSPFPTILKCFCGLGLYSCHRPGFAPLLHQFQFKNGGVWPKVQEQEAIVPVPVVSPFKRMKNRRTPKNPIPPFTLWIPSNNNNIPHAQKVKSLPSQKRKDTIRSKHHSHTVRVKTSSQKEPSSHHHSSTRMQRRSSLVKDSNSPAPALLHVGDQLQLNRKFSITACRRFSSVELPENQFILTIMISNAESNEQISYKQDGARFDSSQLTLKFGTNSLYKIYIKTKPPQNFSTLHIGGSELKLTPVIVDSGEYVAVWNTSDKIPTKKGTRQDIEFVLTGKEKMLNKKLQAKFYPRTDSHAGWGQKLDQITWQCTFNEMGNVIVTEEQTI